MAVTLKDIADKTGVSPSVVSTVLSGRDNGTFVSKDTRERVLNVAQELNYTPVRSGRPRGSRRLRRQRVEQFIGVWAPDFDPTSGVYLQALQKALAQYAADHGSTSEEEFDYGLRLLTDSDLPKLDMLGVMGLIVIGDTPLPRAAAAATTPTVFLGEADDTPKEMISVHMDNFAAGRFVGEHLWALGPSTPRVHCTERQASRPSHQAAMAGHSERLGGSWRCSRFVRPRALRHFS